MPYMAGEILTEQIFEGHISFRVYGCLLHYLLPLLRLVCFRIGHLRIEKLLVVLADYYNRVWWSSNHHRKAMFHALTLVWWQNTSNIGSKLRYIFHPQQSIRIYSDLDGMQILFLFLTLFWQKHCEEKLPIVRRILWFSYILCGKFIEANQEQAVKNYSGERFIASSYVSPCRWLHRTDEPLQKVAFTQPNVYLCSKIHATGSLRIFVGFWKSF